MDIVDKMDFFLNEKVLKEENSDVQKIVESLSRRFIVKLEKMKSKYAHSERALRSERYSIYKNVSSFDVNMKKLFDELKKFGYSKISEHPQNNYTTVSKDRENYIEIYFDKDEKIDLIYFNYKEGNK